MNKLFLLLIRALSPLWRKLGAQPRAVDLIVAAKLRVGERRVPGQAEKGKKSITTGVQVLAYFMLAVFGLLIFFLYFIFEHKPTGLGLGYSFLMLYLALVLTLEMSESLFDTRDVNVLMSRPISDATFSLSRGLYVLVFAAKAVFSMTLLPIVGIGFLDLGELPIFLVNLVLLTVITVSGVLGLNLFLLKHLSTERFKKVVANFQIIFSGFFFLGYLFPSLLNYGDGTDALTLRLVGTPYGFLFPGLWLGGLHELVAGNLLSIVQGALGVAATTFGGWFYLRQGEGFGTKLLELQQSGSAEQMVEEDLGADAGAGAKPTKTTLGDRLAALFTGNQLERASFRFHWAMMLRSRDFKMKVYPTLLFVPVFIAYFVFQDIFDESSNLREDSARLLMGLYYLALTVITPLSQLRISEHYLASWVWTVHPVERRGAVAYGQYLASLSQFFLPTALVAVPFFVYLAGWSFVLDIVMALGVSVIAGAVFQMVDKNKPLSRSKEKGQFASFGPTMLVVFVSGIAGVAHYGMTFIPYALIGGCIVVWAIAFLTLQALRKTPGSYR